MLKFDKATHAYTWNGAPVVNVTRICGMLNSYAGIPADVLARAADRGDAVHFATELYDEDDLDLSSLPSEVSGYVAGWIRFREDTGFRPSHSEQRVYSERYRFAGTLDRVGSFHGLKAVRPSDACIVDIKATATLMPVVGPQTAAYAQAFEETCGIKAKHRFAVQLKPDGTYNLEKLTEPADLSVFLSALSVYAWRARHGMENAQ